MPPSVEPTTAAQQSVLLVLCRTGSQLCGITIECVVETMRPLPVEPLANMPAFVLGVSRVRGLPTPVIHAGRLFGSGEGSTARRFLTIRIGGRYAALAVDAVLGVRSVPKASLERLPPLLERASDAAVSAIGALDAELLLVLEGARFVPESAWDALSAHEGAA